MVAWLVMTARNSAYVMERKLMGLSQRYRALLQKYLKQGPRASLQPARELGRRAASLGLGLLDMARIHRGALTRLESSGTREGIIGRAKIFFAEAITPIGKTHRAALQANVRLSQLKETLDRRTADLTASNRSLKQRIARRKTAEEALKKSGEHSQKLLEESLALQKHLRRLTHRILAAQEHKRKEISHELQDEIAQTLLGINVRLVTLKKEAMGSKAKLTKDIANTQRLVEESVQCINRFARELDIHQ